MPDLPLPPVSLVERSGLFRPIILTNTTLPREGSETELGGSQRRKITYYAGNARSSTQILGPEEDPIRFGGVLEDRRIGFTGAAIALTYAIDAVRKSGRPLTFNYVAFTETVLLRSFIYRIIHPAKISYRIELDVIDDEIEVLERIRSGVRSIPGVEKVIEFAGLALNALAQIPAAVVGLQGPATESSLQAVVSQATEAGAVLQVSTAPGTLADEGRAADALGRLNAGRESLADAEASSRGFDWRLSNQTPYHALTGPGRSIQDVRSNITATARELDAVRQQTADLAGEARRGALYIASAGDTLRDVSYRFYGTPLRWSRIMAENGLSSPMLAAGQRLLLRDVVRSDVQVVP